MYSLNIFNKRFYEMPYFIYEIGLKSTFEYIYYILYKHTVNKSIVLVTNRDNYKHLTKKQTLH